MQNKTFEANKKKYPGARIPKISYLTFCFLFFMDSKTVFFLYFCFFGFLVFWFFWGWLRQNAQTWRKNALQTL